MLTCIANLLAVDTRSSRSVPLVLDSLHLYQIILADYRNYLKTLNYNEITDFRISIR